MTLKEIQELIKLVAKTELTEFKYKDEKTALHIRGKDYSRASNSGGTTGAPAPSIINVPATPLAPAYPPAAPAQPAPAPPPPASEGTSSGDGQGKSLQPNNLIEVKSPMIGTFYRSSSPDKPPYVKVGDTIAKGDTVCVVEAMKLFNEIEAEVAGKIVKVLVEDAQPIEYDQPLFLVDPS
jgi:acetyl-CoA carboxylase biotin carboxyl carrier protein